MARRSSYFKEIERLLDIGYEPKHIMKLTGISKATVYRIVDKLRTESRHDFGQLMEKDYLWKYQQNIENFSKTIQECNEKMVEINKKYDVYEKMTLDAITALEPKQAMTKATLLNNLVTMQSARTNEMIKLVTQRDKATELKARVYNAGPVVYAVNEWINGKTPPMGEQPRVKELDNILHKTEVLPLKLNNIIQDNSDEELNTQMEMEQDEEK